ncbi:MAG: hypothetical protein AB7F43_09745 [Bacteriovoracia bacterium]
MRQIFVASVLVIISFFVASGVGNKAQAAFKYKDALQTVGISTAVGTVLGVSTMAFYDAPFAHFENALIGAGAGLVVGLGIVTYTWAQQSEEDEDLEEELKEILVKEPKVPPKGKNFNDNQTPGEGSAGKEGSGPPNSEQNKESPGRARGDGAKILKKPSKKKFDQLDLRFASVPVGLITRDHNWMVAFQIVELRF